MAISIVLGFYGISSAENVISSQNSAGNLLELSVFLSRLGYMLQEFLKVQHLCLDNHTHSSERAYVEFGSLSCALLCCALILGNIAPDKSSTPKT